MTIVGDEKPTLEQALAHYGVKGMKWGQKKAKVTTTDILGARSRQTQRIREFQRLDDKASLATSAKTRSTAEKQRDKIAKTFDTSDDRAMAVRMTRGEKAVAVILAGPIGAGIIVGNKITVKNVQKKTEQARRDLK